MVLTGDATCTFQDLGHFAALGTGDIPILFDGVVFSGIETTGDKVGHCVAVFGPLADIELDVAYRWLQWLVGFGSPRLRYQTSFLFVLINSASPDIVSTSVLTPSPIG